MVGYEDADGTFHEAKVTTADWKWAEANYAAFLEK
jgi:hypothetical protein